MGLSASSLRIAMLTARKSSLEFEGQQINQQRLSLSNQTAALFNAMLTMQVPTPPDPTEFSKMVYTFNKGDGLSTLLNVSRNASGPYTHDVTYKGPKTDSVLMKKQLNNVGFKHENGQMSAVIDGMNYDLTLNGNEEKLNEYLKTKGTYDNLKNIEAQMSSLQKMSSTKELSSQQMKQYFEALGLSSYNTPKQGKVDDVKTMDDAFQNLYNAGNEYSYEEVTLTYDASTSPFTLDSSKRELLGATQGGLKMGSNNQHYTYTTNYSPTSTGAPDLQSPISYNISQNDSGEWSWTLENVSGDVLEKFGITYERKAGTVSGTGTSATFTPTETHVNGNTRYINISHNGSSWSWDEVSQETEYYIGKMNLQNGSPIPIDETIYTPTYENGQWSFTTTPECVVGVRANTETSYYIDGQDDFVYQGKSFSFDGNNSFVYNDNEITLKIDKNNAVLSFVSNSVWGQLLNGKFYNNGSMVNVNNLDQIGQDVGYWYNCRIGYVAINEQGCSLVTDREALNPLSGSKYNESSDWVYVTKTNDDKYSFQFKQLQEEDLAERIKKTEMISGYTYNKNIYSISDEGKYICNEVYYDKNRNKRTRINILSKDEDGNWQIQYRYTAAQLGITIEEQTQSQTTPQSDKSSPPPGMDEGHVFTYNNGTSNNTSDDVTKYVAGSNNAEFQNGDEKLYVSYSSGKFNLSGTCLPNGVSEKTEDDGDDYQYQGTSNGVTYTVIDNGAEAESGERYSITAKFKAWVTGEEQNAWNNDEEQDGYSYDKTNHTLTLTTPNGAIVQILLRNQNNQRDEDCDKNITVNEMLGFYEQILKQFGLYGSSATYKTKLDKAKSDYLSTIDAKGVENPGENQALFNFIDANGKNAYI